MRRGYDTISAMSSTPKLTVCVPCFNEERFIGKAIESLLSQTYNDFTVQVVDDCSTDGTLEEVRKFSDPRIVVHRNRRNLGLYQNQNRCLQLVKTEYVKILCADDYLEPTCLSEQVVVLYRDPRVVLVFGASQVIDSRERVLLRRRYATPGKIEGKELVKTILLSGRNPLGEPTGVMFRQSVVQRHRLRFRAQDFSHMADLDFWIQLLEHGDGYSIDKRLFSFRLHNSAGTVGLLQRSVAEHRKLLREYEIRYPLTIVQRVIFHGKLIGFFLGKMAFVRLFAR
jgi:glycosyltransferase involved in cell wall biosynthesis